MTRRQQRALAAGAIVWAAALGGWAVAQRAGRAGRTPAVDPEVVRHAESLSRAFRQASEAVLPTVVTIQAHTEARRGADRENPFRGSPFEGTPLEDLFEGPYGGYIPPQLGTGSGVIIDGTGLILTNNHVVTGAVKVTVKLADSRTFTATDVRTDPQSDLAIVKIEGVADLPAAALGDSDVLEIGDWVVAIGNPFELEASVSAGIISAKGRSLDAVERANFLQTDAAINPGNSGGPLVNLRGEVIGINTAIASRSGAFNGIGFAIPINQAKWVAKRLIDEGVVRRAWLGVTISAVTPEVARPLGLDPQTRGVLVREVRDGTPAARAGLRPGDVITHFAGAAVTNPAELQRAVERATVDRDYDVRLIRNGRPTTLRVRTEPLPGAETAAAAPARPRLAQQVVDDQLGLEVGELTPEWAKRLGYNSDDAGVRVARIVPGSIAFRSQLLPGMLIQEVGGQPVRNVAGFQNALKRYSLDDGVVLTIKIPRRATALRILKR